MTYMGSKNNATRLVQIRYILNSIPCNSIVTEKLFQQTNAMAVTTSAFPNLNTFMHGPEFCVLFRKLKSTCQSHKKAMLTARYPKLCQFIENNQRQFCLPKIVKSEADTNINDDNLFLLQEVESASPTIVDFGDDLTKMVYQ